MTTLPNESSEDTESPWVGECHSKSCYLSNTLAHLTHHEGLNISFSIDSCGGGTDSSKHVPVRLFQQSRDRPSRSDREPGKASGHLHAISGGNGFSMSADGAAMKASTCTSCPIGADLSAYWVPQLYVKFKNGTGYGLVESHQIVYYEPRPTEDEKVIAFPDGLKMLAGDPKLREKGDSIEEKAITWVCLDYVTRTRSSKDPKL
ncbi:protein of unknown function DUF1996 [Phytophthora cactorum]|nr:protein of unknown function DUF1996 [Phytophthora cactorum]